MGVTPAIPSMHSRLLQRTCACGGTPGPTGECEECRKKRLQRKPWNSEVETRNDSAVPPIVHEVLRSPSDPLDPAGRAFMESRFGHDFSQVRVHTDARAAESARAVNALAYTVGTNLVFAARKYSPREASGRQLLAHELAHVVQQGVAHPPITGDFPVGSPNEPAEREADAVAHRIECDKCRRKRLSHGIGPATVPPIVHEVLLSSGQPLDAATRNLMEPRFGHQFSRVKVDKDQRIHSTLTVSQPNDESEREADQTADRVCNRSQPPLSSMLPSEQPPSRQRRGFDFSYVRVHTDPKAAAAVHAVNAEAFAVNHHIVFGAGRYAPGTSEGQRSLAHELAHVVQQPKRIPDLRRKLRVDPNHPTAAPPSDPAASLTSAQRFSMMDSLIQGLCDQFEVDSSTGEVRSKSHPGLDRSALAGGAKPTGCCCLAILTDPSANVWTIEVSQVIGAETLLGSHQVILNPTTTPVEFGSFTTSGTLAFQGAVPAAGHELCGHAAIDEIGAHPPQQDRTTTDVHDPTVRIENLISSEQGVPPSELRGLAASGPHRGESVDRITIQNYPFNVSEIPAGEQSKIQFAAAYIIENNEFVDVLGHSDSVGSNTAKQSISDLRASKVQAALIAANVPPTISKPPLTNVPRFSRVEGLSDTHPPPPPLDTIQGNWRRVDILMAGFPAGAQKPPTGTPTTVTPHIQKPNVPSLKASGDPCVRLLVGGAYP